MARQVDPLGGLLGRHALLLQPRHFGPRVAQIRLEVVDLGVVGERLAVAGQHRVKSSFFSASSDADPLVGIRVAQVRERRGEEVAGDDDLLARQEHDDVAGGVAAAQEPDLNLAAAAEERHLRAQRDVGRHGRSSFCEARLFSATRAASGARRAPPDPSRPPRGRLSVSIWPGMAVDVALVERHLQRLAASEHLARELVADDVHAGAEDLVAVRVVEVEVGVDHVAHRLGREALHLLEQHPGGGRRDVVVHDHHVVVVDDDGAVADHGQRTGAHGVIDALGFTLLKRKASP